ncbi:hypothetical protein COI93_19675 [Bacillus cereus]|uniref:Uncharacterized protein n=1 Tax=Bacillus cereus TaxID=1396 RepID=A0A2B0LTG0_BACCE|nr:hypothetical protein COI93_19675 [Bacillus cereus]
MNLFSLSVFTQRGAKKGTDRFYLWTDPLFQQKKKAFLSFQFLKLFLKLIPNSNNSPNMFCFIP